MELGIYTLGDLSINSVTGKEIEPLERMEQIIESAQLADELGLDVFGVGEHHRLDYIVSAPAVVLGAIASNTNHIRLTSSTTVLSTTDPVRLYEQFATLDLVSNGRAEVMAGRGAFFESFGLFGYEQDRNQLLFKEHMDLFLKLNKEERLNWKGKTRSMLKNAEIAPRAVQLELPVWIGVGGSISSAKEAGVHGTGLAMAILSRDISRFIPLKEAYEKAFIESGHIENEMKLAITSHGFIAETSEKARNEFFPYYQTYKVGQKKQTDSNYSLDRNTFENWTSQTGALFVGSPQEIAEKIIYQHKIFGHERCLLQLDIGGIPFDMVKRSIRLFAEEVAPIVREHIK